MNPKIIEQLVHARGIESEYTDAWGNQTMIEQSSKEKILAAMGYPMDDEQALVDVINNEAESDWLTVAPPVIVTNEHAKTTFVFNLPIDFVNDELTLNILQDDASVAGFSFVPVEAELVASVDIRDVEIQKYVIEIDLDLDMGYFQFELMEAGVDEPLGQGRLIVAPEACYKQPELEEGKKMWGPSVQLYCVKSKHNWGVGDF
ncbi:MAG: 4-alpha-glucanotransferase, partial [Gammaproteobacteria bacterium]|nr:4-alpha-glucanotransferase [Gammaproteobacteria bacterium]